MEARFRPLLTYDFFMSYAFLIDDEQGRSMLTAESWQAGAALLWREHHGLQFVGKLMGGRPVLDPTLWRAPDR